MGFEHHGTRGRHGTDCADCADCAQHAAHWLARAGGSHLVDRTARPCHSVLGVQQHRGGRPRVASAVARPEVDSKKPPPHSAEKGTMLQQVRSELRHVQTGQSLEGFSRLQMKEPTVGQRKKTVLFRKVR